MLRTNSDPHLATHSEEGRSNLAFQEDEEGSDMEAGIKVSAKRRNTEPTTIVSFVLENEDKQEEIEAQKTWETGHSWEHLEKISILYGMVLVLIGISFFVTEALREAWLTETEVGIFLLYLYIISILFILYSELLMMKCFGRKNSNKDENRDDDYVMGATSPQAKEVLSPQNPAAIGQLQSKSNLLGQHAYDDNISNTSGPNQSTSSFALPKQWMQGRRTSVIITQQNEEALTQVKETNVDTHASMEDVVKYASLSVQTASQGHEGTCLYLRLGCLSQYNMAHAFAQSILRT